MPDCQFLYSGKLCIDSVPLCVRVCVCVCVCVRACVRACVHTCVRERERGMRTLITLWNRIEYVTRSHEMGLNLKFGSWRYLHVSNLHFLLVILIFTEVARKRPWSFCQKCMVVWCTQNLTGRDGSSFMWHQPCQRSKCTTSVDIQKCAIKSYLLI